MKYKDIKPTAMYKVGDLIRFTGDINKIQAYRVMKIWLKEDGKTWMADITRAIKMDGSICPSTNVYKRQHINETVKVKV